MSCPQCFSGAVHDHAKPEGHFETLYGVKTYVSDKGATSKSVVLYLPDFFGLHLVNNKLLADRYAQGTGCKVLFPDIIPGGGASDSYLPLMETVMENPGLSPMKILKYIWSFIFCLGLVPLLFYAGPEKAFPEVLRYARAIKKDLPKGGKLGVCGFCWGGYGSTNLCAEPAVEGGNEPLITAQFTGHPSRLKLPDMILNAVSKFNVPYSAAIAEHDFQMDEKLALETEAALTEKIGPAPENNWEIKVSESRQSDWSHVVRSLRDNVLDLAHVTVTLHETVHLSPFK